MTGTVPKANWNLNDAPRLDGKLAIVTGATGGLGYEIALGLAHHGAMTILAGRNPDKGAPALARIRREIPSAKVRFERLDLASLASVARFAEVVSAAQGGVIDILVNNAGVMAPPTRQLTDDGFEQQLGVNFLGHFALTARLRDALCAAPNGGRVISVASLAHRRVSLRLDNLQSERAYSPRGAYAVSKLAMLMFAVELQRRAERNNWNLRSIAAHPGWARTDIIANGMGGGSAGLEEWLPRLKVRLIERGFALVAQSAQEGALPILYAAMAPGADGAYYGPSGYGETRGAPGLSKLFPQALDLVGASRLWAIAEQLTGVIFG